MEIAGAPARGEAPEEAALGPDGCVRLGLIVTTNLADEAANGLAEDVESLLTKRYPEVCWDVSQVRDPMVSRPANLTELVDAARTRLLDEGWDLAVSVTDLPLRLVELLDTAKASGDRPA